MEIILKNNVKNLGRAGDKVKVAAGYARNYLLPKALAVTATPSNIKRLEEFLNSKKGQVQRVVYDAQSQAELIQAQPVVIIRPAGENGKLFGSVTAADIETALEARGLAFDKRKINLDEPLKLVGEYQVKIKLHSEVTAELTVQVQAEVKEETPVVAEEAPVVAAVATDEVVDTPEELTAAPADGDAADEVTAEA